MEGVVLVKLGGSLLTDKSGHERLRARLIQRLMGELTGIPNLVLVHGAGSFAHPHVKKSGIGLGPMTPRRRAGVEDVRRALHDLESHVIAAARHAGLRAIPVSVAECRRVSGRLTGFPYAAVRQALASGLVPVLHGDLVVDQELGYSVLGGDEIMWRLASKVRPDRVVFATDVDGVFDADPKAPGARLVTRVPRRTGASARGRGSDVTGRMAGKLDHARRAARFGPVLIVNGRVPGRVGAALRGRRVTGSHIG